MFWHAFSAAHRRAVIVCGVATLTICAFAAGAMAGLGDDGGESRVSVETVNALADPTTTVASTSTTVAPSTTTTVPPPPPTTTPPPPPAPLTAPPPPPPPPPPAPKTYTFDALGAGSITVKLENGVVSVVAVNPAAGWTPETHTDSGTEYVKVMFRQGNVVKYVKVRVKHGELKPETGEWTECDSMPPAATSTYELGGVGSITVTWNGSAFTLDAVQPYDGWQVSSQEAPGDYVRVYFSPVVVEPSSMTDGGHEHDAHKWIKVKIHECQITHHTS